MFSHRGMAENVHGQQTRSMQSPVRDETLHDTPGRPSSAPPMGSQISEWVEGGERPLLPMPPGVVPAVLSDLSTAAPSATMTMQDTLRAITQRYDLPLSEYGHIEWLVQIQLLDYHQIDLLCGRLNYRIKTDSPVIASRSLEPNMGQQSEQ